MNVGDYVRVINTLNEYVEITKIKKIIEQPFNYKTFLDTRGYEYDCDEIIRISPNIIDLIEVGDYVNGDRVKALKGDIESHKINNEDDVIYTEYINDYDEWCGFEEDEIKSIVTKEQFSQMEYKIQ